jgi:hypothetical protein
MKEGGGVRAGFFTRASCALDYKRVLMMRPRVRLHLVLLSIVSSLLASIGTAGVAAAQPPVPQRLRVYLDCDCFQSYLRDEITWVDYVRQPQDADVHLLSTSQETGGGGRELVLRFVGMNRFDTINHDLRVVTETALPENLRRAAVLRTVTVGLLNYMARDSLPPGLDVEVDAEPQAPGTAAAVSDPWNLWVFRVSSGASLEAEESSRETSWDMNFSADRVTENWKVSFGANLDQQTETFDLDEDDPFKVTRRERRFDWFLARSLGPHWSLGFDGDVESSTFGNTKFSASGGPAVEFSIFPYREYATRQFVVQYQVGVAHAEYTEVTLFGLMQETRGTHELSSRLDQRQPWGSVQVGAELSQYFHDLGKYRLEVDGELSLRITRGLSLNLDAGASRIRDQLSLPRRDATPEEVLLELRELQSGYDLRFQFSVSYSFGSLFNNVVNPRFGN